MNPRVEYQGIQALVSQMHFAQRDQRQTQTRTAHPKGFMRIAMRSDSSVWARFSGRIDWSRSENTYSAGLICDALWCTAKQTELCAARGESMCMILVYGEW